MEEGSTLWWIEQHRLRALERDALAAEVARLKEERASDACWDAHCQRHEQKEKALIKDYAELSQAARDMVKHQRDRHELSHCCKGYTPTETYKLQLALEKISKRPECAHVWEADGDRDVCTKCGSRTNPVI